MNKTREQIQAEVKAAADKQKRNDILKRVGMWGGAIIVLGAMVWGLAKLGSSPGTTAAALTLKDPVDAADWGQGSRLSRTTLVEYSDFQCPTCAAFYPIVKELTQKYNGQFLFVYRYYPLTQIHKNAALSASVAEAAGKQGKFWEMHDLLFTHQIEWGESNDARKIFTNYANQLKLNINEFNSDVDSAATKARIDRDVASGDRAGITGTPTFFLNGTQLTNIASYGDLEQDLVAELNKK